MGRRPAFALLPDKSEYTHVAGYVGRAARRGKKKGYLSRKETSSCSYRNGYVRILSIDLRFCYFNAKIHTFLSREERTDMLPATVMSWHVVATVMSCTLLPLILTRRARRASYFYSAGCALHCLAATLSGHGY